VKKFLIITFLLVALIGAALSVGGFIWWTNGLKAPSTSNKTQSVLITKGSSAESIAKKLHDAGVIKNELVFRLYVRFTNQAASLPVGQFSIPANLTVPQVIAHLLKGPQEVWVTIPEGLRREQLPDRFSNALGYSEAEKVAFREQFLSLSKSDEGYLFPETYLIPKDVTPARAISVLKNTFQKKFGTENAGANLDELVTLASLVERETRNDSEKPIIAGILRNRIEIGMPLQVDATVQYAKANLSCPDAKGECADWWPTVYLEDYKLKSNFNTYTIPGLPPAPIASPGLASLQAVLNPTESNYLFYIHDTTGVARYATTLEEHNANVQKYLR